VSPVDLGLLADETLGPQVHLAARDRPHLGHVTAQDRDAALVAAQADHVEQARRTKARMGLERLVDERPIGVDQAGPRSHDQRALGSAVQHPVDDVWVNAELGGDRPALPLLDVVKAPDLVLLAEVDRHSVTPSRQSWRRSPKFPKPWSRRPCRRWARYATSTS
jgi:hypothetical protein